MRHRTKQAWLALFEQQRTSGLTSKAFCEQQPLNPNYFSKRRGELESPSPSVKPPSAFVQLTRATTSAAPSSLLLRTSRAELELPAAVSPQWLALLLKALA